MVKQADMKLDFYTKGQSMWGKHMMLMWEGNDKTNNKGSVRTSHEQKAIITGVS